MRFRIGLGLVARAVYILWPLLCLALYWLWPQGAGSDVERDVMRLNVLILFGAGLLLFYPLMWGISAVLESRTFRDWFRRGLGGSARWGGVLAFRKYDWYRMKTKKAPIYLGRTKNKHDPRPLCRAIGVDDENHLVTIAQTRSGKSTTVIWPNLVKYPYPDSVFVLDPKGEHAVLTGKHRVLVQDRVYVLDPFNETKGQVPRSCFNPLAEIDPASGRAKEDIGEIADACVISAAHATSDTGEHFDALTRLMITGLIAHIMTTQPPEKHNLPAVYDYFIALRDEVDFQSVMDEMERNGACGNAPREAVSAYRKAGKNEKGSIFTSMMNALRWISSEDMRNHLMKSDFSLSELRTHKTSIYVVLDFDAMVPERQGRYMRVLFNLALRKSYVTPLPEDRKKAGRRTLFILDEVAQLGHMPKIQQAYRTHAGADVKLWCFFQEWEALTSTFTSPRAVIGNSTKQFFGCNDPETAREIESYLGQYLHERKAGRGKWRGIYESSKALLDASEIMDTLGQKDPAQIVITGEGDRLELRRTEFIPGSRDTTTSHQSALWVEFVAVFMVVCVGVLPPVLVLIKALGLDVATISILIFPYMFLVASHEAAAGRERDKVNARAFAHLPMVQRISAIPYLPPMRRIGVIAVLTVVCVVVLFPVDALLRALAGAFGFAEFLTAIYFIVGLYLTFGVYLAAEDKERKKAVAAGKRRQAEWERGEDVRRQKAAPEPEETQDREREKQARAEAIAAAQQQQARAARVAAERERAKAQAQQEEARRQQVGAQEQQQPRMAQKPRITAAQYQAWMDRRAKEEAGEAVEPDIEKNGDRTESQYSDDEDVVRKRWVLPVGFTDPQVDKRLPIMLENAEASNVDAVMEEYALLKACAA